MSASQWVETLPFKIDSKFSFNFDELQNIQLTNRKSDIWFSEEEKMMLKMRPWTIWIWNEHNTAGWVSNQYFFTDFYRTRWHMKWYNNWVWRLENNTWVNLALWFTGNEFEFNSIQLPLMSDWTIPAEYTAPTDSPWAEQINKDAWDATINPIWQYLIITDDPNNNQSYRWAFAAILEDDWTTYTLNGSWITSAIIAWAKYQIYDTKWEYLQIINWVEYEKFIFIKSDETVITNTFYTWMVTQNLRNVKAIWDTDFVEKQLSYSASYRIFNKWTLYPSDWALNNPFFYTFTWALTIPWNNWWDINDIFIFKWRMIVGWNNFIAYFQWWSDLIEVDIITNSYWIVKRSLVDLWVDAYYLTTNKQIYSLSETITWAIISENVWKIVNNYLQDFDYWVCAWYDWRRLYFYGQLDQNTEWKIVVLDVEYKFWSTHTWLKPSTIVLEWWSVYLSDNDTSIIRIYSEWSMTDIDVDIEQKVSLKDIDLWDPFSVKSLTDIYVWLDNYTQTLDIDTYMSVPWANTEKITKTINLTEVDTTIANPALWTWVVWTWIIWWFQNTPDATYPFMKHIDYDADKANIWKVIITWVDGSWFYLNHLDIEIWFDLEKEKNIFPPRHTI